jgi:hypothetical protein
MVEYEQLPPADPGYEKSAERLFSNYKSITPEQWAARYAHTVGCSGFGDFKYRNDELGRWIYRLHEILERQVNFPDEIDEYRKQYLSAEELARIQREKNGPF